MILLSIELDVPPLCIADCRQFAGSLFDMRGDDGFVAKYAIDYGKCYNPKI
jgi:hypothetical protein